MMTREYLRAYIHKDLWELIHQLSLFENKSKVEVSKEIADFIRQKYIQEKYKFRLFR